MRRFACALLLVACCAVNLQAQTQLAPYVPVDGLLAPQTAATYTFSAREGTILSFLAQGRDSALDPRLTLYLPNGSIAASNDDYDYPDRTDALIEAFTVPRTGTYTLEVAAVGQTSGEYRLEMFEGFPTIVLQDNFSQTTDVTPLGSPANPPQALNGSLRLAASGIDQRTIARHPRSRYQDFYATVRVASINHRGGWIVGMMLRQQDDDSYYTLELSDSGVWRFRLAHDGETRTLRDWTNHPAIVASQTSFSLSVLANGGGFNFFYDGQFIGAVADTTLLTAGASGFLAATRSAADSSVQVDFDDFFVTVPTLVNNERIIPGNIVQGSGSNVARQLQNASLIPIGGELVFELAESFASAPVAGVTTVPLARGSTFTNFVLSASVSMQTNRQGIGGCGILGRAKDESYVLAYADTTGGYGLAERAGSAFTSNAFGQYSAPRVETWLVLVAVGDKVHLFVDGVYFSTLAFPAADGSIGSAVVNFDVLETTCRYRNIWLYRWQT
jgi:hypothetical protein